MVGQIIEIVRTNRNVGPLIERGLSEDTTNKTTVVAIKALANPTDLSANTPPFPWKKNNYHHLNSALYQICYLFIFINICIKFHCPPQSTHDIDVFLCHVFVD